MANRIDVHHHVVPAEYVTAANARGSRDSGGIPFPKWSLEATLELMERRGIATAITSLSAPGVHFGDDAAARRLARTVNEVQARLVSDHPERFGAFASLPIPDVDGALDELAYALDVLKLDGVVLLSSHRGVYLGDATLDPLFAELQRRKAVVFVHPETPATSAGLKNRFVPDAAVEYVFDTTRAAMNLVYSGTLERCPDVKIILSHAGGTLPYLAGRIATMHGLPSLVNLLPKPVLTYLRQFYYDTAISALPATLAALRELADPSHVLFGSDYPYLPESVIQLHQDSLDRTELLSATAKKAIGRDNALALFPRLRA